MVTAAEKMIVILVRVDIDEDPQIVNTTNIRLVRLSPKLQAVYSVRTGMVDNILYNRKIDFCAFLKRPTERMIKMVFDDLKRHAKPAMPASCPVEPIDISLTNMTLNHVTLPSFLPQTNFQLQINFWEGPNSIFSSRWHGRLKKISV
ncbi:AGAP011006-PA-like protein [Anopheles sinensis]|uniref:AGAP011006-PA-like protein n=1 Tax=Anopheles sinensis TaxID=74873 RepID=A0A084W990_ANOSI|nr:AGAP011006-PA-like protein [Anopheles sinensis]